METALQEVGLETAVPGSGGLPGEGRVAQGGELLAPVGGAAVIVGNLAALGHGDGGQGAVRSQGLGAVLTPGELELEEVQPLDVLHEFFVGDRPGGAEGREVAPLVLGTEHGGTVAADGGVEVVGVLEGIDETGQVTHVRVQDIGGIVHHLGVRVAQAVPAGEGVAGFREALAGDALAGGFRAVAGVHQGGVHVVLAEGTGVGKDGIHDPVLAQGVADGTAGGGQVVVLGGLTLAFQVIGEEGDGVVLVGEAVVLGLHLGVGGVHLEVEALHPGDVDAHITAQVQVVAAVVLLAAHSP